MPNPTLSAVPARALPRQAQRCTDHSLPTLQSLDLLRLRTSRRADLPRQVCPTATTFWTWQIPRGLHPPTAQTQSVHRSIPQPFNAPCAQSALHEHTIFGRICARIQTSALLSAVFAAKHLPVSTTGSDTRGYILERRSLSVEATSRTAATGAAVGDSPALTLLVDTSDLKQAASVFAPC